MKLFPLIVFGALLVRTIRADSNLPQELTEAMKKEPISLQSGDLFMRFYPERAWTFREIKIGGKELTQYESATGLVLKIDAPGEWIGTAHHEAGVEQVEKVTLTVDGREGNPYEGGSFTGEVIELTKQSTLANALTLKTTFRLDHGKLITRQEVEVFQDLDLKMLYAFMYPWLEETTFWMAKLPGGDVIEGDFSDESRWELRKDAEWTAIYHPQAQIVAWVGYAEGSREGAGVRHGFWNVEKRYHKQYYQPLGKTTLRKGQRFDWKSEVRFLPASETQWREVALAQK